MSSHIPSGLQYVKLCYLCGHHLGVGSGDVESGVQTAAVVRLDDGAPVNPVRSHRAVVRTCAGENGENRCELDMFEFHRAQFDSGETSVFTFETCRNDNITQLNSVHFFQIL